MFSQEISGRDRMEPKYCSTAFKVSAKSSALCSHRVWKCSPEMPDKSAPCTSSGVTPRREPGAQGS